MYFAKLFSDSSPQVCLVCCRCLSDGSELRYEAVLPRTTIPLIGHDAEDIFNSSDEDEDGSLSPVNFANATIRVNARDHDPDRLWKRMLWSAHSASCLYLESFESYYHMKYVDFEDLYALMAQKKDPRAGNYTKYATFIEQLNISYK
jgi:hypothetical protein